MPDNVFCPVESFLENSRRRALANAALSLQNRDPESITAGELIAEANRLGVAASRLLAHAGLSVV